MARKWVYLFSEGNANMRELLGGKGANHGTSRSPGLHHYYGSLYSVL